MIKDMGKNSKTIINVICSMMVLATNIIIGFWLSPFIVKNIGVEANGFVTLANNFVTYANLLVSALNSMAARFITISYVEKDYKKANLYYNSVFWGNLIIDAVLIIPAVLLIVWLEKIIDVPEEIIIDVKILFSFIFFNFFVNVGFPNWECGTYVSNRLDKDYIPQMATTVFRCVFIFATMTILVPKVWYVGLSATIVSVTLLAVRGYNTHKLTPHLNIKFGKEMICSKDAIVELVSSGIWNSISNVGNMLLSGLDLIISNVFLGATAMGIVSLSKTLPNYIQQLAVSITNAFAPELTINYAKGDMEAVYKDLNRSMKLTSIILTIPIAAVVIFGKEFFSLWVPSQDAQLLQILSVLAILGYMFTSGTQILFNVFSTVNKVKNNAIAMLISGVVSMGITILMIYFTDIDIYAVAGVSTFVNLVRNMTFTLPATAKYLGYDWKKFYPQVITTVLSSLLLIATGSGMKLFLPTYSWVTLIISIAVFCCVALLLNFLIILSKEDRKLLLGKIAKKLSKS